MRGKLIGILSDDFRLYHELVTHLKSREVPFVSLSVMDDVPINVGVIIAPQKLARRVKFKKKVIIQILENVEFSVNKAIQMLRGKERFGEVVIGIDPGAKPGMAILGDGDILNSLTAKKPEQVVEFVKKAKKTYPSDRFRIKIGHGDMTNRNRIINSLENEDFAVEVVDERSTTKDARREIRPRTKSRNLDAFAALKIARANGRVLMDVDHSPTKGELKLVQSRSRALSSGRVSISKELAEHVARGDITLKKALSLHDKKKRKGR
ncbi:MAG: hypothetical protein KAI64_00495 [Thermoplasmata archaeon]|nr:hypothetical protein [Thermoplasmata archaeon]